jgi:hypothetical protein
MTLTSTSERSRSSRSAAVDVPPKTTLFCACGRAAPPDAWRIEADDLRHRLICPDCETTLTVR